MEENPIQILERVIVEINALDFSKDDSYDKTFNALKKIPYLPIFQHRIPAGSQIFRARTNRKKDLFTSIEEITYPKPEYVPNYGRLNKPGQSIFYCAENRPTSYMELVETWAGEVGFDQEFFVTVSEWIVKRDMFLTMFVNPNTNERVSDYDKMHGAEFDKKNAALEKMFQELGWKFMNFASKEFFKYAKHDKTIYIKTSALSNLILSYNNCDGIIYPSVPFMGDGFNIVLRPEIVDSNDVVLNSVLRSKLKAVRQENGKHNFVETEQILTYNINHKSREIKWENKNV